MTNTDSTDDIRGTTHWPVEIRLKKEDKRLEVDFDDGRSFTFPAEFLRVLSPSAEVQGHGPGQRITPTGCMDVDILKLEPVGNYALRIHFDDLHDTGIYTWSYLYDLGENQEGYWADYLAELESKGLSRVPSYKRAGRS